MMDWFESLFGFREGRYETVQANFRVADGRLHSLANGASFGIGHFELVSLATLRQRVQAGSGAAGRLRLGTLTGEARALHRDPACAGALIQAASQFNCLEMFSPHRTPEDGITAYAEDRTQGPACALAAAAATVYRNYLLPVGGGVGQRHDCQIDGLRELGEALARRLDRPLHTLWSMRNGYALCSEAGLEAIDHCLAGCAEAELDALRARLRIGLHWDVEVSDGPPPRPIVSQAFCSALPVAYCPWPRAPWARFATLVLEAAYEATLLAAVCNARRGASRTLLLTRLGGGVFGNAEAWIDQAMTRALTRCADYDLDVRIVQRRPA